MRDIKIVKLSRNKNRQQYKVYHNKCKRESQTVKKQKVIQEKKKRLAEGKVRSNQLNQFTSNSSKTSSVELDYEETDFGRRNQANATGKLLLQYLKAGNTYSAKNILLSTEGKVCLEQYNCSNHLSALGYALLSCSHTSDYSDLDCFRGWLVSYDLMCKNGRVKGGLLDLLLDKADKYYPKWQKILGKHIACLNLQNSLGDTLLHYACFLKRPTSIKRLLRIKIHSCLQIANKDGQFPIHILCGNGCIESVNTLLAHGGFVDEKDNYGQTPLHIACVKNNQHIVALLLQYGADPFKQDDNGCNALCIAILKEAKATINLLQNSQKIKIEDSTVSGKPFLIYLLDLLSNKDDLDDHVTCHSFLHYNNYFDFLIELSAHSPLVKTTEWNVADTLKLTLSHCEVYSVDWWQLLKGETFLSYKNKHGNTLLHYACKYEKCLAVEKLVKLGAPLNQQNKNGNTPLHWCIELNQHTIANILLSSRDSSTVIDKTNTAGYSALAIACSNNSKKTVEVLVRHGADMNKVAIKIFSLVSPIDIACKESPDILAFFLHCGANVHVQVYLLGKLFSKFKIPQSRLGYRFSLYSMGRRSIYDNHSIIKKNIKYLISAGATWPNLSTLIEFERYLCSSNDIEMISFLLKSGYQFHVSLEIPDCLQDALSKPMSLQLLASQNIRTNLFPNAWFSVHKLPLPSMLKNLIVMDFNSRDIVYNCYDWMFVHDCNDWVSALAR